MKIGIIGCGAYSLAVGLMINKNTKDITFYSETQEKIDIINKERKLDTALKDVILPSNFKYTTKLKEAVYDKDIIFLITAAKYIDMVCQEIKDYVKDNQVICIASKGINPDFKFMHEIVLQHITTDNLAVISGPSFAIDMAKGKPCGLSVSSLSNKAILDVKNILASDSVKLRENNDIIGTQICGSIKNVMAIASGIIDGLGYSESTQALFISEAIHDIRDLIVLFNGNPKTMNSFAGIGDLILTCNSLKSRNYSFGKLIGQKPGLKTIQNYLKSNTVEGYETLKITDDYLNKHQQNIPIFNVLYKIVYENNDPTSLINFLIIKD